MKQIFALAVTVTRRITASVFSTCMLAFRAGLAGRSRTQEHDAIGIAFAHRDQRRKQRTNGFAAAGGRFEQQRSRHRAPSDTRPPTTRAAPAESVGNGNCKLREQCVAAITVRVQIDQVSREPRATSLQECLELVGARIRRRTV